MSKSESFSPAQSLIAASQSQLLVSRMQDQVIRKQQQHGAASAPATPAASYADVVRGSPSPNRRPPAAAARYGQQQPPLPGPSFVDQLKGLKRTAPRPGAGADDDEDDGAQFDFR